MRRRQIVVLLWLGLCFSSLLFSQKALQQSGNIELYVYVTLDDGKPAQSYKVQILTRSWMQVSQDLTNDRGLVIFRNLGAGDYRIAVTGMDIEKAETELTLFSHGQYESTQNENIQVRRINREQPSSTQGTVSAATLNIPDKARKEFEKGLVAFDKQDFPVARERFAKAVELYPQYCGALLDLGVIAMHDGQADEGRRYFERAMQADPQNPAAYIYLARVYIVNKEYKQAEPLLAKATAIVPLDPEPLTLLASSELQQGEFAQAVVNAKKVHTLQHQRFAIAHFIAGQALAKESLPQQAADEYRLFLQEAPDAPNAPAIRAALAAMEHPK